jgi:hypothetical protein
MIKKGVHFNCSVPKVDNPAPHSFDSRYPLLSNFTNSINLNRDEIYCLLLNLESHITPQIYKTTKESCLWQLHAYCQICDPDSADLIIYCYENHFQAFIKSFCPHQNWKITKGDGKARKLETRNDKGIPLMNTNHPFRVFGKKVLENENLKLSSNERSFLEQQVYSHGHLFYQSLLETNVIDLDTLFHSIPGVYFIELRDVPDLRSSPLIYQDKEVVQITYIHPLAISIVQNATYYQIDASFKALRPYAYSIPLGIIQNEALPLGLQMSPSEKGVLYGAFFKHLEEVIHHFSDHGFSFEYCAFLSDQGKGLIKFVEEINGRHYYCYRHLIEAVGSSTFPSLILRRLLFTSSFVEYEREVPQAILDLESLRNLNQ